MISEKEFNRRKELHENYRLKFGESMPVGLVSPVWTNEQLEKIYNEAEKAIKGERGILTVEEFNGGYAEDGIY